MDDNYTGANAVRDETRRPMVERASPAVNQLKEESPLLIQAMNRINEAQNRVADMAAALRDKADNIVGAGPEHDTARSTINAPCSGALGGIFEQICFLEQRLEFLEEQVARFRPLA